MAFMDLSLDAPLKPNKGLEGGACNRQSCQAEPANWFNHGSHSWYCADCKRDIGEDIVNRRDWEWNHRPTCGHAMFETRAEMNERLKEIEERKASDRMRDFGIDRYFPWASRGREKPQSSSLERILKRAKR